MVLGSLSRTRERVGVRVLATQPLQDRCQHTLAFGQRLPIVESHDVESVGVQRASALRIRRDRFILEVLPAIQLDDQHRFDAGEVCEASTDRMLTTKLVAVELAVAQRAPDRSLGVG